MAKDRKTTGSDEEVWNAILACEQILEAMPNDRHSLRTLANAYEQVGDLVRSQEFTIRLAQVILAEEDEGTAGEVRQKLLTFASDKEVQKLITALEQLAPETRRAQPKAAPPAPAGSPAGSPAAAPAAAPAAEAAPPVDDRKRIEISLNEEIALAWALHQAHIIPEDDYAKVVEDLTRLAGGDAELTVSVFHVLQDRGSAHLEKALNVMATKHACPIVALANFQFTRDVSVLLPIPFIVRRGVVPFEIMGDHVLVALLNPQHRQLRTDVEAALKRPCFFYLVAPGDFDKAVERIREMRERPAEEK